MEKKKIFIIAEAGINHNGDLLKAYEMVDLAKTCGADAVKFQTFLTENLVTNNAKTCEYQNKKKKYISQKAMLEKFEIKQEDFLKLKNYTKKRGIEFMSTAFDLDSLNFLIKKAKVKRIKIASGDLLNPVLLFNAAISKLPIILSTGMANLSEIEVALGIISFSSIKKKLPSKIEALSFFKSKEAQKLLKEKVTILQCTTEYPTSLENVNLNVISTLKQKFKLSVGLSDHTEGINVAIGSVALGVSVIEKHFTLNKRFDGPDHSSSLEKKEFKNMVKAVRQVELALGSNIKKPSKEEKLNKSKIRGKLITKKKIKKNEVFSLNNLTIKRSDGGRSAIDILNLIGNKSKKNYGSNEKV